MISVLRRTGATVLAVSALALPLTLSTTTATAASYHYANCTALHKSFKHGVGRNGATDHHSASSKAVTNFKRSTTIYNAAMKYNSRLDRDKDGIACEQH